MLLRSASFRAATCCAALLFVCLPAARAQNRDEYSRAPQPRPDVTIFSPLELPTPNRVRTASGAPGPDYWQQQVDYRIDARLDPVERRLTASEQVTYHNNSPEALDYLWVHLEQNILRKDSIGSLVDGGAAIGGPSDHTEGVLVSRVASAGAPLPYKVYDTLMRVDLPRPLLAGSKLELQIDWSFEI
ncbi:MAG TPA: M1 family peptidase, partial [Planctomycetota bacterium]|nr:M1 family peptidase [Planctomycetota bacterium]